MEQQPFLTQEQTEEQWAKLDEISGMLVLGALVNLHETVSRIVVFNNHNFKMGDAENNKAEQLASVATNLFELPLSNLEDIFESLLFSPKELNMLIADLLRRAVLEAFSNAPPTLLKQINTTFESDSNAG